MNDGSSDNCGRICDEYAQKDKRFKVIHRPNGGVSTARQTGLDETIGDFVIHCDPDDWIEPTMLEEMLKCAISNNADMVICDFFYNYDNHQIYSSQKIIGDITAKTIQKKILEGELYGCCWNKLVRKDVIKGIGFFPSTIQFCEDTLFNVKLLNNDIKIVHLPCAYYHYKIDNGASIINSRNSSVILSRTIAIAEIEKHIRKDVHCDMYAMKKSVIDSLFITRNLKELPHTFPEIHATIIEKHHDYYFFTPLGYFLSRALKRNSYINYLLYNVNIKFIDIIQWFRNKR